MKSHVDIDLIDHVAKTHLVPLQMEEGSGAVGKAQRQLIRTWGSRAHALSRRGTRMRRGIISSFTHPWSQDANISSCFTAVASNVLTCV